MATAVGQIGNAVSELQGHRSSLASATSDLVGSSWIGTAAKAFEDAYTIFDGEFAKMITSLTGIQDALRGNQAAYEQDEAQNQQLSTKVSGVIQGLQGMPTATPAS